VDIKPDYQEFRQNVKKNSYTAVYTQLISDMETPITLFRKLSGHGKSFLLESGEGEGKNAQFSFMGFNPFLSLEARDGTLYLEKDGEITTSKGNPFETLQEIMEQIDWIDPISLPFSGGAVGYFGYDLVNYLEPVGPSPPDDRGMPDMSMIFPREILAFDHRNHLLTALLVFQVEDDLYKSYKQACGELKGLIERLQKEKELSLGGGHKNLASTYGEYGEVSFTSNLNPRQYTDTVEKVKELIYEGEIFQLVASQRLEVKTPVDPFLAYRTMRSVSPSPYQFYLDLGEVTLCGSSPEMLVRVENGEAWTRPIAGTRPRGNTPGEDEAYACDLLADEKERAEHIMLVDLGRNDLGKVCNYGSVRAENLMQVERYSHVMHITTDVKGTLAANRSPLDALKSCFPAGTVTGAPKVRAMQLINQLEPTKRGPYSGAVGYLGFNGNMDTCITIRTIVAHQDSMFIQAGAGIVADSIPESEYQETLHKTKSLLKTLSAAEGVNK